MRIGHAMRRATAKPSSQEIQIEVIDGVGEQKPLWPRFGTIYGTMRPCPDGNRPGETNQVEGNSPRRVI